MLSSLIDADMVTVVSIAIVQSYCCCIPTSPLYSHFPCTSQVIGWDDHFHVERDVKPYFVNISAFKGIGCAASMAQ